MITFMIVCFTVMFWIVLIGVAIELLVVVALKIIELVSKGRLKFFNRGLIEPIYSKEPRSVSFF